MRLTIRKANARRLKAVTHKIKKTNGKRCWFVHTSHVNHWRASFGTRISGFKLAAFNKGSISIDLVLKHHDMPLLITPIEMISDV